MPILHFMPKSNSIRHSQKRFPVIRDIKQAMMQELLTGKTQMS
jgi:hypothetical protein